MRFFDFIPCSLPLKTLILLTFSCFLIRRRGKASPFSLSKNLVEFAPAGANKMSICFVRWRVHRTKHITGCKCGICAQAAHKLCAPHRAAFSNANPAPRFAFESLSKRLFDKLRRRRKASPFSLPMDAGYAPSCCRSGRHGGKCAPPLGAEGRCRLYFGVWYRY